MRRWRQSSKRAANWVSACSAWAVPWGWVMLRQVVFMCASKSDDVLGDTVGGCNLRCHACSPEAHDSPLAGQVPFFSFVDHRGGADMQHACGIANATGVHGHVWHVKLACRKDTIQ